MLIDTGDKLFDRLPDSENLDIRHLIHLFDNMSECYKLFWFQAILDSIEAGKEIITFGELIDNMIADAWYMVSEYHLNLGPADTLESLVNSDVQCSGNYIILKLLFLNDVGWLKAITRILAFILK